MDIAGPRPDHPAGDGVFIVIAGLDPVGAKIAGRVSRNAVHRERALHARHAEILTFAYARPHVYFLGAMEFDGFNWDKGNREKCRKHGVSIAEIESLFVYGTPLVGPDPAHSVTEQRFRAIGITAEGRSLFVVFTWRRRRKQQLIRPISARYMHE